MATTRKKKVRRAKRSPARRRAGRRSRRGSRRRLSPVLIALLLGLGFAGGFSLARYSIGLDRVVRARFEGRLFRVPSRVVSAPTILYPGLDADRIDLPGTLARLGYREVRGDRALQPGQLRWLDDGVEITRRAFDHPRRPEPPQRARLHFEQGRLSAIEDPSSGRVLGALLLEPEPVGSYHGPDREQRELVRIADLPPHLIDAVLAVEDQRFHQHPGIDLPRILGALWVNLRSGRVRQGGSTLTQQLVKNFFLTPERSLRRKLQEALMALIVEARYEKDAILESYLNEIYLGQRGSTAIHGVGEAARHYFGKSASGLTPEESALLAAIIQSPNGLSPYRQSDAAKRRRNLVLDLMYGQGRIDGATLAAAKLEPLRLAAARGEPRSARYFLDALRRQLPDFYGTETLTSEGLRIYSTLDLRLQRLAATIVTEELERLEKSHPALVENPSSPVQACLVALRPQTGAVLALVGGRSYGGSQFDRCTQARRPAGSVFKPFVYAAALDASRGRPVITLASRLDDTPLAVSSGGRVWRPANYDKRYHGTVSVREAMERSLNVATARLGQDVGIENVAAMAARLGLPDPLPRVPSLAIGTADVSPLALARAYATFANGGVRPEIRTFEDVVDGAGQPAARQPIRFERAIDEGTAFLVTSLLRGVVERGTARRVRSAGLTGPIAAKTGTSDDERDAWLAGYTPELAVVVWVGFDDPRSLGLPASRAALPIWTRFLEEATGGHVAGSFPRPGGVARVAIDPESGARSLAGCPRSQLEWFVRGTEPRQACPSWASSEEGERAGWLERVLGRWGDRR